LRANYSSRPRLRRSRPRPVTTEHALRVATALLLALLGYQGNQIMARLAAVEKNQTAILIHLGIPPIADSTLEIGVKNGHFAALETIKEIKRGDIPWKSWTNHP
jgi:hypothetical protein